MTYECPVCFYPQMLDPPADYNICPCCGTEFGNDDAAISHAELRDQWVANGARWFFETPPPGWNALVQLLAGQGYLVPGQYPLVSIVSGNVSIEPTPSVGRRSGQGASTATDTIPLMRAS